MANVLWGMARTMLADDQAVRALYVEHGPALLAYASRLVGGDRQQAEDIVQETLVRAWRHPAALAPEGERSPRAWLFTVARNLAIDSHRARLARPRESPETASVDLSVADDPMGDLLTRVEMLEAIDTLAPHHRVVIIALFYRGHSVAEAAELLGVPEGTIKSRCHYALRALRVLCDEAWLSTIYP
jgi:RNA polymerase sigma-70 factor (ECF subfamily)